MKLIRVTFLLCAVSILFLLTPTSSLQLKPHYSSPSQGLREKIVIKTVSRKLMIASSEHVNVMTSSTVHDKGSSEQLRVTSSEKSKDVEKKRSEEEEKNTLSKYLSMDYPKFRRRRPVHNSLPRSP